MATMQSGIYQIVNTVNGKSYVGSAVDLRRRRRQHWHALRSNRHTNPKLQASWNKYGEEWFVFRTVLLCSPENCVLYEQCALDALSPEFNIDSTAGSRLGATVSAASREKMRAAKLGRPGPWAGKTLTAEHRAKLASARIGVRPANYGVPCSEDQKAKIRAKLTKPPKAPNPPRVYRRVVDTATGAVYNSVAAAARSIGITGVALRFRLCGRATNATTLRYADGDLG